MNVSDDELRQLIEHHAKITKAWHDSCDAEPNGDPRALRNWSNSEAEYAPVVTPDLVLTLLDRAQSAESERDALRKRHKPLDCYYDCVDKRAAEREIAAGIAEAEASARALVAKDQERVRELEAQIESMENMAWNKSE